MQIRCREATWEMLKYLEMPLGKYTCRYAAPGDAGLARERVPLGRVYVQIRCRGGHLEVLKYLHENGCPWGEYTCRSAAEGGHLEVLKYAHENGCPWDEGTCMFAHPRCRPYLIEHGCPVVN